MNAIVRTTAGAAAACLLATHAVAADGVLIAMKVTSGSNPPMTNQIQIEQKRMRMAVSDANGTTAGIMFDGTRQVMTIIDDGKKTYSELTKADMDAFSAQISGAMAQMQEMMKNAPPEQRAQMEALMKGRMGGAGRAGGAGAAPKVEYRKAGTATVGKWTCDKYDGYTNGQKTHEVCTVDPKALGFSEADFQVTRDMAEFFKAFQQFRPAGGQQNPFVMGKPEDQGYSGVPIRSIQNVGSANQVTSELTDVHRQAFTDATFQVPAGYQKNELFGGRGRRGR
jgi:hypothetical protein